MNLIGVGIEAEAFPQACFMQIAKQISLQHTIIGLTLADPSGVAKGLAEIKETDADARLSQRLAHMAHINRCDHTVGNAGIAATFIFSSKRRLTQKEELYGNNCRKKDRLKERRSLHRKQSFKYNGDPVSVTFHYGSIGARTSILGVMRVGDGFADGRHG